MFVVNLTNSDRSRLACTPTGGCRSLACMFALCCLTTALILWFYLHICRDLHCGDDYYDDDDDDDNKYYSPQLSYYAGSLDDDYTSTVLFLLFMLFETGFDMLYHSHVTYFRGKLCARR